MQEDIANAMITATVEFRDDGRYEINCPKGHSSVTLLQQQKFEILFDIGAYAILDGYYREAVSSFTSSLERFYEFFIKVVCISKNIDWDKTQDAWKEVSNQSERQLGAFIFLHLQETGKKPTLLSNNKVKFRNEVIHKGKIPSKEQAIQYGQAVLDVIRPLLNVLKADYSEAVSNATFRHLSNTLTPSDDGIPVSTMCISTIISLSNGEPSHDQRGLEEAINQFRRW
ncbi:hypothetical protein [Enterovibrio nigricans]|nr:hypothetical protein [Enterovibrio nigricans]